jgi:hypothetical protein
MSISHPGDTVVAPRLDRDDDRARRPTARRSDQAITPESATERHFSINREAHSRPAGRLEAEHRRAALALTGTSSTGVKELSAVKHVRAHTTQ